MRKTRTASSKIQCVLFGLFAIAQISCVKTESSLDVNSINSAGSSIESHCGWVTVTEEETIQFLGATLSVENREFHESFFYCCPGESGTAPVCYEARWRGR